MAGFLLHLGARVFCPHNGLAAAVASNFRVRAAGQPVTTLADSYPVAGCPSRRPCLRVQWLGAASRVRINGQPALLNTSPGMCVDGAGA
ncbi:MAG: hypothetical protein L0209_08615, partial [candidate division Zixibacteria bacterium]|nr:hypothetical protein [candidate division Zixibacteria bacterium]